MNKMGPVLVGFVIMRALLIWVSPATAFTFESGEMSGSLDITVGYGAAWRVEEPVPYISLGEGVFINSEHPTASNTKSDLEYDGKELVSNVFRVLAELDVTYKNYGLKSTASYSYDTVIMVQDRDLNTDPNFGVPFPQDNWTEDAEDASGSVSELLDAYVYGYFFDDALDLRVGKQVINWGEGLFFQDGVATQVPLNINKLVLPGSELKEAYIGIGAVRAQIAATYAWSIDGYVQWEWEQNQFPGTGTFYGDDYLAAPGAEEEAFFLVENARDAKDGGQWGISTTYFMGDVELGFYYSRYHDPFPKAGVNLDTGLAFEYFAENQDMYGASLSTALGSWTFNTEVAYRPDRNISTVVFGGPNGIGLNDDGEYWTEADTAHASVHGIWLGGQTFGGIDSQIALVQLGMDYIDYDGDMSDLQAFYVNHDAVEINDSGIYQTVEGEEVTSTAWGIAAEWDATWQAVVPNLDLTLALFAQYDFSGNSHLWGNFAEGRLLTSVRLTANYGNGWEASVIYARMDYDESNYETQDTINFGVNYKF